MAKKSPAPNVPQRVGRTARLKPAGNTPRDQNAATALKTASTRHAPPSPVTARLMYACDARRVGRGLSFAAVARAVGVDKADVCRALTGREEPSVRTRGLLVGYFGVGSAEGLNVRDREVALLTEARALSLRQAEILGELAGLRALSAPEV